MKQNLTTLLMNITAAVLCAIIAITAGVLIRRGSKAGGSTPTEAENYDEIYKAVQNAVNKSDISLYARDGLEFSSAAINEQVADYDVAEGASDGTKGSDYSKTNTQTEGVDEADKVKTDGRYIYVLSSFSSYYRVRIADTDTGLKQLGDISENDFYALDMFLADNRLVVLGSAQYGKECKATVWDISNPEAPVKLREIHQSGEYTDSRLIADKLYLISTYRPNAGTIEKTRPETYVPSITCGDQDGTVTADSIYIGGNCNNACYTVTAAYTVTDGRLISTKSLLGGADTVYASRESIIIAAQISYNETALTRLEISDGEIKLAASGTLAGTLLNQFSIDEYNGYCRFVITKQTGTSTANELIVTDGDLKETGRTGDLAHGERVYSVRFMGDAAYFVTFRETDPLFSADLSNPAEPKIIGSLKIPGFSDYLFPYGNVRLLGVGREADEKGAVTGLKLSLFDISDPANVTESAKTVINAFYSEANYNHKATLADYNKNLIALPIGTNKLHIYSLNPDDSGFTLCAELTLDGRSELFRGLYIGDLFYAVSDTQISEFKIDGFEKTDELIFK